MTFFNLLRRELYWILKSPALLWSLLPLLLMVHLLPTILWMQSGLSVPFAETMWGGLSITWSFGIKSQIEQNFMAAQVLAPYLPIIDEVLRLPAKDLWPRYLVPSLQVFSLFPLGAVIPPLAVTVLRRDLDHGAYRQLVMNGVNCISFLMSKLIVLTLYCFLINLLCHGITLIIYQNIPGREEYFHFFSPPWLLCHYVATGFGAWVAVTSWWGCIGSKNGCTEIYVSCVIGGLGINALAAGLYFLGLSSSTYAILGTGLLLTSPLGMALLWIRMRQASFILNG